jgi:large subunit ribosomal protein L15
MKLNELKFNAGSSKKENRVGRGTGSGNGKTSGTGHKGQNSRSGGGTRPGFEGGQTPIYRRISKRGFHNHFRVEYQIVNLSDLERVFENGEEICLHCLFNARLVSSIEHVKLLGQGTLTKKLIISVHKASASAVKAVTALGGEVKIIEEA